MSQRPVELADVASLKVTEEHGPQRVLWLCEKVLKEGVWSDPIKVERSLRLVMDGHHRFEMAKRLNLARVPVQFFDYDEVGLYSLRDDIEVSVDIIFDNHAHGRVLPYKTAKHIFPQDSAPFDGVALDVLRA